MPKNSSSATCPVRAVHYLFYEQLGFVDTGEMEGDEESDASETIRNLMLNFSESATLSQNSPMRSKA